MADNGELTFSEEITSRECFSFGPYSACNDDSGDGDSAKLLCFGGFSGVIDLVGDSSPSSTCNSKTKTLPKSNNKKRNGFGKDPGCLSGGPTGNSKKPKSSNSSTCHAKVVKKERLGERISALQKLVSPFGKTDTASVLHEASGYIRFLQDQVQVLSSPYMHRRSPVAENDRKSGSCEESDKMDLRSKGLCLVPIELTLQVAKDSNGADLWSSAGCSNGQLCVYV